MKTEYRVDPRQLFILYFADADDCRSFERDYRPEIGFYVSKINGNYRLYTNARYYYIKHPFFEKSEGNTEKIIGLYIGESFPIDQKSTLDVQMNSVRFIGLPASCLRGKGISRDMIPLQGGAQMWQYLEDHFSEKQTAKAEAKNKLSDEEWEEKRSHAAFVQEHGRLIEEEKRYNEEHLCSFEYDAIESTNFNTMDGFVYRFHIGHTDTAFSEKTNVKVAMNNGASTDTLFASVFDYKAPWLYLKFKTAKAVSVSEFSSKGVIQECVNVEFSLKLKALAMLKNNTCVNQRFLDIVVCKKLLPLKTVKPFIPKGKDAVKVNESQKEAITKALSTEDFLLVQGPPGTGKTTIITEMVKHFASEGLRVLICSKNNLAVDNVLEKCDGLYYDDLKTRKIQCLRLGHVEKVLPSVHHCLPRMLALSIQKRVEESSKEAYALHDRQEAHNFERYERALKYTRDLCEVIRRLLAQRAVYKTARDVFSKHLLAFVLLSKKKKMLAQLNVICDQADNILDMLVTLLEKRTCLLTPSQIQSMMVPFERLIDLMKENAQELQTATIRYRTVFGASYQAMLTCSKEAQESKETFLSEVQAMLISYSGNSGCDVLDVAAIKAEGVKEFFVEDFCLALQNGMNKAQAVRTIYKTVLDEWHNELRTDQQVLEEALIRCVKIVGATCIGVNTTQGFSDAEYDVAIVDEAGQITLHDLLVPLVKAKKVILIGDHLQLPPSNNDEFCKYLRQNKLLGFSGEEYDEDDNELMREIKSVYTVSLFEELFRDPAFEKNRVMLNEQYRMHPIIAEFVSRYFYGGEYKSGVTAQARTLSIAGFDQPMYFLDTSGCPDRFEDKNSNEKEHSNLLEAKICARHVADMIVAIENGNYKGAVEKLKTENGDYDIGVITPYAAQTAKIKQQIRRQLLKHYDEVQVDGILSHITVNTLDSFQGRDNQIVFYSFVRSNPECNIGFLYELRRINVMMTRAKSLLVMVGDAATLNGSRARAAHSGEKVGAFYEKLVAYCRKNQGYIRVRNEAEYE